jgi:hypothetical protein
MLLKIPNCKFRDWFPRWFHVPNVVTKFPICKILIFHRQKKEKENTPLTLSPPPPHPPIFWDTAQLKFRKKHRPIKKANKKKSTAHRSLRALDLTSRVLWKLT